MRSEGRWQSIGFLLLLLLAIPILYAPAHQLLSFSIIPDSAEYACGARHFAETGKFAISVNGVEHPPRYEPFFPIVGLGWAFIATKNLAVLSFVMLGYSLAAVIAAWLIGARIAGARGAWCTAFFLLSYGLFRSLSQLVLSDVPSLTFVLFALVLYLNLRHRGSAPRPQDFLIAGLLGAGAAFRFPNAAILLPFVLLLRSAKRPVISAAALASPVCAIVAATAWFNLHTFGSYVRNGYHYWNPVPYEFSDMVFRVSYLFDNFKYFALAANCAAIIALCVAVLYLVARKENDFRTTPLGSALTFTLVTSLPILFFYLIYFFPSSRFYLPIGALFMILLGAAAGKYFELCKIKAWQVAAGCSGILSILAAIAFFIPPAAVTPRYEEITSIRADTPPDAFVITALDPVYTWCMDGDSGRTYLPISRRVEYASKIIAPKPLQPTTARPWSWDERRWPKLFELGGTDPVQSVAIESLKPAYDALAANHAVFADLQGMTTEERHFLAGFFSVEPTARGLVRLQLPHIEKP